MSLIVLPGCFASIPSFTLDKDCYSDSVYYDKVGDIEIGKVLNVLVCNNVSYTINSGDTVVVDIGGLDYDVLHFVNLHLHIFNVNKNALTIIVPENKMFFLESAKIYFDTIAIDGDEDSSVVLIDTSGGGDFWQSDISHEASNVTVIGRGI